MQDDECGPLLGGSWVVISGVIKSPNMGYNYSYLTSSPTHNYPWTSKWVGSGGGGGEVGGSAVSQESVSLVTEAKIFASCRRTRPPIPAL